MPDNRLSIEKFSTHMADLRERERKAAADRRIIEAARDVLSMLPENNHSFWLHCPSGLAHALSDLCEAADQEKP